MTDFIDVPRLNFLRVFPHTQPGASPGKRSGRVSQGDGRRILDCGRLPRKRAALGAAALPAGRRQNDPRGPPLFGPSSNLGPMVQTYFLRFLERRFWVQHNYLTDVGVSPANSSPPVVLLGPTVAVGATGVTFWSPSKLMFVRVRERSSSSIGGDE